MKEPKKERDSNIELLRIISIILIIMGHMIGQSGIFPNCPNGTQSILLFMGSAPRIAVNIFLMIATWYMVDRDFQVSRIVKLYSELFLYVVTITIAMFFWGEVDSIKNLLRGLMPLFGRPLWFASAYIFLLLLSPYLQLIFKLESRKLSKLIIILFVMICVVSSFPDIQEGYVVDSLWFIFIYIFMGFYKKNISRHIKKKTAEAAGVVGILIYVILVLCLILKNIYSHSFVIDALSKLSKQYLDDIKTIPNFLCAFLIFVFFLNINMNKNVYINKAAKSVFAIYIVHQVPLFIPFLWNNIFKCYLWPPSNIIIIYCIVTVFAIYIIGSIVDFLRIKYIEQVWIRSKAYNIMCSVLEKFYNNESV